MRSALRCGKLLPVWVYYMPVLLFFLFHASKSSAQVTYDWVGTNSTAWNVAANWQVSGTTSTTSPTLVTDIIRIGVTVAPVKQLDIGLNISCSSITFGGLVPVTTSPNLGFTVTINSPYTLTVTDININHSAYSATTNVTNECVFTGTGNIVCTNTTSGNATTPVASSGGNRAHVSQLSFGVANFTVTNVNLRTTSNTAAAVNNATFQLSSGNMTLSGQIKAVDDVYVSTNITRFVTDNTALNTFLTITSLNPFSSTASSDYDFTNGGSGIGTVTYAATSGTQEIYTTADDPVLGVNPRNYENISFTGAALKKVHGNKTISGTVLGMTVGGNWTSDGGSIDLTTNNPLITIAGSLTNSTTINQGSGNIDIEGAVTNSGVLNLGTGNIYIAGNYTNSGTYTQSTGTTIFDGITQTLTDNSTLGTIFNKVLFTGNGTNTLVNNKFAVSPIGVLTLANSAVLVAGGNLTINSNASSSGTIATIPAGSSITGNVSVQRFIKGSSADLTKRGYRLLSAPVSVATVNGVRLQSYNYLLTSVPVSGLTGGGFNVTGNPTLYLYREDITPTGTTFTSSNYKGIAKINNTNAYDIGTQKRFTTTNINDTTVNVPVGNGTLFFFRGNTTDNNGSAAGSKTTLPFNYPEDVTLTSTGVLNQGTVAFRHWFNRPDMATLSYTNSSAINNNTAPRRVRGYNLVGNPYASAINWNKLNRNATVTSSSIYAPTIDKSIWFFNPTNKQYEAYLDGSPASSDTTNTLFTGTGSASNIIASGQGFFVRTTSAGGGLQFLESAKTITQPVVASLNKLMGIPVSTVDGVHPYLRIQLKKDSVNDDDILIRFNEPASENYVLNEDAEDIGGNGALVSLSSFSVDKMSRLAINGMPPVSAINKIFLAADATESGLYELHRKEFVGAADVYQVWLKDNFTKDSLDFRANDTYTFRIDKNNSATFGDNRFELVFRKKPLPPYELLSFTAQKTEEGVLLKWKVLNEYAYTGFTLQKADGDLDFAAISRIQSDGKGNYSFIDTKPNGDTTAYRILQNKPDGKEAFSPIVIVKNTPQKQFTIYPNPASDYLVIQLDSIVTAKLKITDAKGRIVYTTTFTGKSTQVNLGSFKAGAYFIDVSDTASFIILGREKWLKL